MTVIAVTSSRTSPGATSLAAGLALSLSADYDRTLLIEADPAGGVLSLRFDLDVTPSLTTFGSDTRNGYSHELAWRNTQDLRGVRCIPGPVDPRLARSWVERVTPALTENLKTLGAPAIIDLGWIAESGPSLALAAAADVTLVVTRPEIAEVQALLFQVRQLQAAGATVGLVTVGTTPNDPQEVAAVAGVPLVAVLPNDAAIAAALCGGKFSPNKFRRSLLWRTIGGIAATLVDSGLMLSRATNDEPAAELSEHAFGESVPPMYAELAPEALAAAELPAPQAQMSPAAAARASFTDRHPELDAPRAEPEQVNTDPDAGQYAAVEFDLTDGADLTVDPELFDDTIRMVTLPEAELILDTGERRPLRTDGPTVLGRHGTCDIVLADSQVSRQHAQLTRTATGWLFADLESRNGSVVNGRPCTETFLSEGDELYIGHARLVFAHSAPAAPSREMENA